jgi:uncharacterized phiE125 gp8 family phage protein
VSDGASKKRKIMSLTMTAGPALEPVSLAEAKAHLRVDGIAEDALITSLIVTSRLQLEALLGLALISQSWLWRFDAWPNNAITFPLRPVLSVVSVRVQNADLSFATIPPAEYSLDGHGMPARLVPMHAGFPSPGVPALGIEIQLTAGFGAAVSDVPAPLRQAILLLVAHWFENREPEAVAGTPARLPEAIAGLVASYRMVHL